MGGLLRDDTAYIQGLIDAAEPGATVVVPPGDYCIRSVLELRGREVDGCDDVRWRIPPDGLRVLFPGALARIWIER